MQSLISPVTKAILVALFIFAILLILYVILWYICRDVDCDHGIWSIDQWRSQGDLGKSFLINTLSFLHRGITVHRHHYELCIVHFPLHPLYLTIERFEVIEMSLCSDSILFITNETTRALICGYNWMHSLSISLRNKFCSHARSAKSSLWLLKINK